MDCVAVPRSGNCRWFGVAVTMQVLDTECCVTVMSLRSCTKVMQWCMNHASCVTAAMQLLDSEWCVIVTP